MTQRHSFRESKLQQAIKNNANIGKIKEILSEDPRYINHVDKCGYTALQDACADGNLEVVEVLLQHNVLVNSVHGKNNTTALMSACHVGATYLIEPLLNANADVNLRDKNGWSAADYLEATIKRERKDSTKEQLLAAEKLLKQLRKMEKSTAILRQKRGTLHQEITEDGKENDEIVFEDDMTRQPKKARKKSSEHSEPKVFKDRNQSMMDLGNVDEERPRKPSKLSMKNRSRSFEQQASKPSHQPTPPSQMPIPDEPEEEEPALVITKKRQSVTEEKEPLESIPKKPRISTEASPQVLNDIQKVVVKIDGNLIQVFLPKDSTVEDLAQEASKRYFDLYEKKPVLKLFDELGAAMHGKDQISMILATSQSITFNTIVSQWIQTPLDKAYETFCEKLNSLCLNDIKLKLVQSKQDGCLKLQQVGLVNPQYLEPVFKALQQGQKQVEALNLSMCKLSSVFSSLCLALSNLENLNTLNLSNNCLNSKNISDLAQVSMPHLTCLDLSFNNIQDKSSISLEKILNNSIKLTNLQLSHCGLTNDYFQNIGCDLGRLKVLNVSYNRLGVIGICNMISKGLKTSNNLQTLDLSGCIEYVGSIHELWSKLEGFQSGNLTILFKRNAIAIDDIPDDLKLLLNL